MLVKAIMRVRKIARKGNFRSRLLQVLIFIRVQAEYGSDKTASGLELVCPMPQEVQRVSCSYEQEPKPANSMSWDWQEKSRRLVWKCKRFPGGSHRVLRVTRISK